MAMGKGNKVGDFFKSVGQKIKKLFSPDLENFPKGAQKILKQYGDLPVIGISLLRTPLPNILNRVLSILTLGGIDRAKKQMKYEDLFHLYLVFDVAGGKQVIVEKNERPDVSLSVKTRQGAQSMSVPIPRGAKYSINEMLQKTINDIGKRHFFQYRAFSWNCQDFIRNILNSNALLSPQLDKFIMQDVNKIVQDVPEFSQRIGNLATDAAALVSKWLGRGRRTNSDNVNMCRQFLLQYTK